MSGVWPNVDKPKIEPARSKEGNKDFITDSGIITLFLFAAFCAPAPAQDIRLVSEFDRYDPYGSVHRSDRGFQAREILSPAVPRNGHLTLHVVVSGPTNTNYFLYIVSNPPDTLDLKLYREHWSNCGPADCGDWLTPLNSPAFGALPESLTEHPGQNTRNYLLDIYVPPDVPPRRVRVEALMKVGIWYVAPMEVRVVEPTVPDTAMLSRREELAPVDAPAGDTALRQLLRFNSGLPPTLPLHLMRSRDFTQRNAAEDMWLAKSYRREFPELNQMSFFPLLFPLYGAEWYLKVRDFLYRLER